MSQIHVLDGQKDIILDYITAHNIISDNHKKSLEETLETYDFITFADRRFSQYLEKRNRIIMPDEDETLREFVIFEAHKYKDTEGHKAQVFAHASYLELKKASILYPDSGFTGTASQHGGRALNNTGWQIGIVEATGTRKLTIENHTNPYEFLKRVAKEFEVELRFRVEHDGNKIIGRYVDLLERVGEWQGREVEFGKDLDGIRRVEKQDIVTALLGLGPEREDGTRLEVLVEDEEALQRWGRLDEHGNLHHLIEPYEIESTRTEMTEAEARQYTRTALNKRINTQVTYETTIIDLENVPGMENKKIRFGDSIRIKDTTFNPPLYLEARVFEQNRSIKSKAKKDIKLGDYIEYTEEEVNAIWNQMQAEIRKRLDRIAVASITSSAGNIFKNAQGTTELTARTFVSGSERDEDGTLYDYQWMRFDKDGNHDTNFYAEGKTITVTANDIDEKATYRVLVAYELEVISTNEITISNVFDGAEGPQGEKGDKGDPGPNVVDENTQFGDGYDPTNIEIGGRNYALNSDELVEYKSNARFPYDVSDEIKYYPQTKISVSFDMEYTGAEDVSRVEIYFYNGEFLSYAGGNSSGNRENTSIGGLKNGGNWARYEGTIYTVDDIGDKNNITIVVRVRKAGGGFTSEVRVKNMKVEKGNKATDWTPAPEDVQAEIDEAKQEAEEAKQEAQQAQTTADGKNSVFTQSTAPPTAGRKIGDVWFDTSRDNLMHRFDGTQWVEAKWGEQSLVANSITALHIKSLFGLNVNDQFVVDNNGNVKFSGNLTGASGTFGEVTVTDGDFKLKKDGLEYSATPRRNLIKDHSFELVRYNEQSFNGANMWADPIKGDIWYGDHWEFYGNPKLAIEHEPHNFRALPIFGKKAMVVRDAHFCRQQLWEGVAAEQTYTISAFFKRQWNTTAGQPRFEVDYMKHRNGTTTRHRLINQTFGAVPSDYSVVRHSATFTIPSDFDFAHADYIEIKVSGGNANWVQVDGVQLVEGNIASPYLDSDDVWEALIGGYKPRTNPLWEGAVYLMASHVIKPKKTLGECANGWVLEWCSYTPGEGAGYGDMQYTFLPKVAGFAHSHRDQFWRGGGSSTWSYKFFYVSFDEIRGHDSNGTGNNRYYALCGVYEF